MEKVLKQHFEDIELLYFLHQGTNILREIVTTKMCQQLRWVPSEEVIYLVMYNAGGQRTQEAVEEYTRQLLEEINIIIIWPSACSLEVNALD